MDRLEADGGWNLRSVWTLPTRPFKGAHFAVISPDVVETCVHAGTKPGDVTLDPFAGAGTTAFVSVSHGRRSIGIDASQKYLDEIATPRLATIPA